MWSSVEPGTRSRGGGAEWRGGGAGELREVTITQPVIRKRRRQRRKRRKRRRKGRRGSEQGEGGRI